jgi:hypothetical protein
MLQRFSVQRRAGGGRRWRGYYLRRVWVAKEFGRPASGSGLAERFPRAGGRAGSEPGDRAAVLPRHGVPFHAPGVQPRPPAARRLLAGWGLPRPTPTGIERGPPEMPPVQAANFHDPRKRPPVHLSEAVAKSVRARRGQAGGPRPRRGHSPAAGSRPRGTGKAVVTSASTAARIDSGRLGQLATIRARSGSVGEQSAETAPDFAPPSVDSCRFPGKSCPCSSPARATPPGIDNGCNTLRVPAIRPRRELDSLWPGLPRRPAGQVHTPRRSAADRRADRCDRRVHGQRLLLSPRAIRWATLRSAHAVQFRRATTTPFPLEADHYVDDRGRKMIAPSAGWGPASRPIGKCRNAKAKVYHYPGRVVLAPRCGGR